MFEDTPSSIPSSIENNSTTPKFYFNSSTNTEVRIPPLPTRIPPQRGSIATRVIEGRSLPLKKQDIESLADSMEDEEGLLEDAVADIAEVTNIEAAVARLAEELKDDDGLVNPPDSGGAEADEVAAAWFNEDEDGLEAPWGAELSRVPSKVEIRDYSDPTPKEPIQVGEALEATSQATAELDAKVAEVMKEVKALEAEVAADLPTWPDDTAFEQVEDTMTELLEADDEGRLADDVEIVNAVAKPQVPKIRRVPEIKVFQRRHSGKYDDSVTYDAGSIAQLPGPVEDAQLANPSCAYALTETTFKEATMKEKPVQKIDSLQLLKGVEGRVLTIMEAAFPNEGQREAVKSLIRKEFRREMNKINRVQDED